MPTYTVTATCGGESAAELVQVPAGPGALRIATDTIDDPIARITVYAPPQVTEVNVDFGDGDSTVLPVVAGVATVQRTYTANGTFTVTATAEGATPDSVEIVITNAAPVIRWTAVPQTVTNRPGSVLVNVTFPAPSLSQTRIVPENTTPTNIPVGTTSYQNTIRVSRNGLQGLTLTNPDWAIDPEVIMVEITDMLTLEVAEQDGMAVTIRAASVAGFYQTAIELRFNWGDGTANQYVPIGSNRHEQLVTHTYATPGTYQVTVTVSNSGVVDPLPVTVPGPSGVEA